MSIARGTPGIVSHFRPRFSTASARAAIQLFVSRVDPRDDVLVVLVPAYYGFSEREGSGVIDPLEALGARIVPYRVDKQLHADLDDYERALRVERPDVVLLIHYFGWPDPAAARLARRAHDLGAWVLEDEAHALLSDLVGGVCGRFGEASAISLHKSLPVAGGGLLLLNDQRLSEDAEWAGRPSPTAVDNFDLPAIAAKRRENAFRLLDLLKAAGLPGKPLWESVPDGVVPLNLPYLVPVSSRQRVYVEMNALGFGVVSLYHRLGPGLEDADTFTDSHWLSERIVNLPLHQGVEFEDLHAMVRALQQVLA